MSPNPHESSTIDCDDPPTDTKTKPDNDVGEDNVTAQQRFTPEEEASLLSESNEKKSEANALFTSAKYENAINKYEEAASICPHYLDYELAVLQSNIAACHLKLEQWKDAISSAAKALERLDRVEKAEAAADAEEPGHKNKHTHDNGSEDGVEEEIISPGAHKSALVTDGGGQVDKPKRKRNEDILRIRAKALMRRARARSELGGWANLSGADEDYKALSAMKNLSAPDRKTVLSQLKALPPRIKAAQDQEMGEMWGKLKDLGNGILRPFGLNTDSFNMVKDEKTGGYSMNFKQN